MIEKDKETIMGVHLISGVPFTTVKEVLEGLAVYTFLNFLEKKDTKLPLVGTLSFLYKGDQISKKGRKAVTESSLSVDEFFNRNVGQSVDLQETELEKMFKTKILDVLQRIEDGIE
jgi:hypothetical protein